MRFHLFPSQQRTVCCAQRWNQKSEGPVYLFYGQRRRPSFRCTAQMLRACCKNRMLFYARPGLREAVRANRSYLLITALLTLIPFYGEFCTSGTLIGLGQFCKNLGHQLLNVACAWRFIGYLSAHSTSLFVVRHEVEKTWRGQPLTAVNVWKRIKGRREAVTG